MNRLVPDEAELKALRAMELDIVERIQELVQLYPELAQRGAEVDPLVLQAIQRLAERHERASELFTAFRSRLGIPAPDGTPAEEEKKP